MRARNAFGRRNGIDRAAILAAILLAGCATTGSTVGSGVGDRMLLEPPYYAGSRVPTGTPVAHLPIVYQRGGAQASIFDPEGGSGTPVAALLEEMNAFLDSIGASTRIVPATPARGTPPDVHFGCDSDGTDECRDPGDGAISSRRGPRMRLAVGRPSGSWIEWVSGELAQLETDRVLVLTLEVGHYWPRQKGWRGDKVVELGIGHTASLPWLTALDAPVSVLQLTGALVGPDGKAERIGAEGLIARRTNLLLTAVGAQALISDAEIERIRAARREDLPGQPLVWQVALQNLIAELAGRPELARR